MIRLALLTCALALASAGGAAAQDLRAVSLRVHNTERERLGLPPLAWSPKLAADAAVWARTLTAKGKLEHSPRGQRVGQGENLAMGTAGAFTPARLMGGWIDEKRDYRHGRFPDVSRTGAWSDVGHYTQIVWRKTTAVGCAVARGGGWDYVVCRYAPPGNYLGETAY